MPDYPLLVFPRHEVVRRPDGHGGGSKPHAPGRRRQVESLGPKFDSLQNAFETERLAFQANPHGLAPEFVLVIETRGRVDDFYRAAQAIGMDWLGEIDLDDLEPDEDFWVPDKRTREPTNKPLDGRLYLAMTNQQAMEQLLQLWLRYRNQQELGRGNTKWRDLFDYAKDIRRWGPRDRLRPEVLSAWQADGASPDVPFRLELWFDNNGQAHEVAVRQAIAEAGGTVLASVRIEEIRFHALKGRIPREVAQSAVAFLQGAVDIGLAALFHRNEVRFFLPEAQGVTSSSPEAEAGPEIGLPPPSDLEPVTALLDGHPYAGHQLLNGRLLINDPDDTLALYQPSEMRHGTAMASLILHSELDAHEPPLNRPIYCRPILEPDPNNHGREHIPEIAFAEDRVHRAVVEMFEGEAPAAPSVRIVNLSVGEEAFYGEMSPWARLIDWLSWKYRLLFLVSAGNQTDLIEAGMTDAEFLALSEPKKVDATLSYLAQTLNTRALLSPGESINALTVGAQHSDHSPAVYLGNLVDMLPSTSLASPISRLGPGFRKAIKPDFLMPGGQQFFRWQGGNGNALYKVSDVGSAPGQKVAAPDLAGTGSTTHTTYTRGTSNATALASRSASRLYEILETLRAMPQGERINRDTTAPLLKALLVHGSAWPDNIEAIHSAVPVPNGKKKRAVARFLGYGIADHKRVEMCAAQRATVIGCGVLSQDQAHEYSFPLPIELSGRTDWRRLTITLAWLTPVNHRHRAYRQAKLSFSPPTSELALERQQADGRQVQSGTVQHEILEGDRARAFQDGDVLRIRVSAQGDNQQNFDHEVPYGLVVTLEVDEACGLPIYQRVREKLGVAIQTAV